MGDGIPEKVLEIAQQIVDETIGPYQGAKQIWAWMADNLADYPEGIREFVGLASEWEDQPDLRNEYEQDIRERAAALTSSRSQ